MSENYDIDDYLDSSGEVMELINELSQIKEEIARLSGELNDLMRRKEEIERILDRPKNDR